MSKNKSLITACLAAIVASGTAGAAELKQIGTIAIPGQPLTSFDISFTDQSTGRYYFADRSNAAIDMFDTKADRYIGRVGKFVGAHIQDGKVDPDMSGPNGVVVVDKELWAGDGDSSVKIIDLATEKVTDRIETGGKMRVDEVTVDPKDHVFIGVNGADDIPFVTLISTEPGHKILGKISFPDATDGAEEPTYNADDGLFYVSIPELNKDPKHGMIAVIDPRTAKLVKTLPVSNCHSTGLSFGPKHNFVLGCDGDPKDMPPITLIMNADSGAVVATVEGLGGADMVTYNARNNQYYIACRNQPGGPVLGVIDATTNKLIQKIAIAGGAPHSVTSNEANGRVYLPVGSVGGGDGTIHVYAPSP